MTKNITIAVLCVISILSLTFAYAQKVKADESRRLAEKSERVAMEMRKLAEQQQRLAEMNEIQARKQFEILALELEKTKKAK